jgi:Holliday junction resolvase RusA-like endonuclease
MKGDSPALTTRIAGEFGLVFPPTALAIFNWAHSNTNPAGHLSFSVGALPTSVNKLYIAVGHRRVLAPDAQAYRDLVALALGHRRTTWRPSHVMCLAFLCGPGWLTKTGAIKDADVDNPLKCLMDSIQHATGVRDCGVWELHAWKVPSPKVRTVVYLYDLGTVVSSYS